MSDETKTDNGGGRGTISFTPATPIGEALEDAAAMYGMKAAEFLKGFLFQAANSPEGAHLKLRLRPQKDAAATPLLPGIADGGEITLR